MTSRKTDEILAVDEKGNRYKIIKYAEFHGVRTFGKSEEVKGLDEYRLATGERVNRVSDTEFVIVASDTKLKAELGFNDR